ncbi:MAG: peptidoglycan DD-metalloendopeptidase family protein, partial [Clostridium sp.]|nr:peptidoglycan DD-metalloendopeptidase family protein [Clostridium sp.]
ASEIDLDQEESKGLLSKLGELLSKVGKGSALATLGSFGAVGGAGLLLTAIYRIHYTGEFEFKGIGGEYQTASYKNMNYTSFDGSGNVQLGGLSKENKLTKTYYTLYSDNSYYAVVDDSKKYKNIDDAYKRENLLTPEELREQYPGIEDTEGREKMFQLNPDVLYSLDRYLHKNEFLYPQQFTKPVYYGESKDDFELKMLVDDNGNIVTKSQVYNSDGSARKENGKLKKQTGIWDYGLASVLHYKEFEVKERTITNVSGSMMTYKGSSDNNSYGVDVNWVNSPEIGAEVSTTTIDSITPPAEHSSLSSGTSAETVRKEPAYAIDKAVTAGGTINSTVSQKWQEKAGSRKTVQKTSTITENEKQKITIEKEEDLDGDGKLDTEEVEVTRTHTYEVTYTYEIYTEEYVPYYEGDLDTSDIVGSQYYRQYIRNYSNYIPQDVPSEIDFSVLENEEVAELFVDDDENAYGGNASATTNTSSNVATEAEFKNAVFMGDSLTVGLGSNVNSITTYATTSHTVKDGTNKYYKEVIKKKPSVVILSYGTNDAGYNNTESFISDYKDLISKLKLGIPNVKIYLNKIFPGDDTKPSVTSAGKTIIKNIPSYNNALNQIASESGVTLIDCTNIPNLKTYYENDGIHFKASFNQLWYDEMKKQIVNGSGSNASTANLSVTTNTNSTNNNARDITNSANLVLPAPREGEERSVFEVLSIGSKKDSQSVLNAMKYLSLFEKYGNIYGVDPYILVALCAGESSGNPNSYNGYAKGLMQIEYNTAKVIAYNHNTKQTETIVVDHGRLFEPEYNIQIGTMQLAQKLKAKQYNIFVGIQGYNFGEGGINSALQYYLSGGTITSNHTVNTEQVNAYIASNHVGWLTALFPGDLPNESSYSELNANDGKHSARTWYSAEGWKKYNQGHGTPVHLDRIMAYYPGPGSPWVMKEDGTIVSVDGSATGYVAGNASAISAFNSYLASNWTTILDKKEILFPWTTKLDNYFDKIKKGAYDELKANELVNTNTSLFTVKLKSVDEDIILSMMFALNQGNYLSQYDYMGEAEWKAMYNQLLSSPTGKTWDDKWIGFTAEEVFGEDLETLGTFFKEGSGVNPVVSRKFGLLKNIYTEDNTNDLTQYNEMNFGIYISVPEDTEVLSIDDGTIINVVKNADILSRYGNFVEIKYNSNTRLIVANLKSINSDIKKGKTIKKGNVIGKSGGNSKSYKEGDIHIELLYNDEFINPEWLITRDMKGFEDPIKGNTGGSVCGQSTSSTTGVGADYVETALQQTDKPYIYGDAGPNSFDCSGLVYWSMKQHGIDIPRDSRSQRKATETITFEQLQRGDLIFRHGNTGDLSADTSNPELVKHVMIYLGDGKVLHASSPERGILVENFNRKSNHSFGRYTKATTGSTGSTSVGTVTSSNCQAPGGSGVATGNYVWPTPELTSVSSPFGMRIHPVYKVPKMHNGIDIPGPQGSRIVAIDGGTVTFSGVKSGYGNVVYIDHGNGVTSRYAHCHTLIVKQGDSVSQGQDIATVGTTGVSTGNHLHFEIRENDTPVDPLDYVNKPS